MHVCQEAGMGGEFDVTGCGFNKGCRSQRCVLKRVISQTSFWVCLNLHGCCCSCFSFQNSLKTVLTQGTLPRAWGLEMVVKRGRLYQKKTPRREEVSVKVFPKCQRALLRNDTIAGELTQFTEMNSQKPWANPKDPQLHTAVESLIVPTQQVSSEDLWPKTKALCGRKGLFLQPRWVTL